MYLIIEFDYTKDTNAKPEETTRVVWAGPEYEVAEVHLEDYLTNKHRYYWVQEINE